MLEVLSDSVLKVESKDMLKIDDSAIVTKNGEKYIACV